MMENQGNSVIFYWHFTEDGVSKTGLTVTADVYEVIRDGTATLVVDDGSCVAVGAGIYRYLLASGTVDAAAEYIAVAHTATDTVDAQDIPAMWVIDRAGSEKLDTGITLADDAITAAKFDESTAYPLKSADTGNTQVARVGADSDTLETLSDEIAAVKAETAAILVDTGTDGVKINATQGAITWGQQKIVANVAGEGALDIENTSTGGFGGVGIRAEGEFAGQYNAGSQTISSAGQYNTGMNGVWNNGDSTGQYNLGNALGQYNYGGSKAVDGFDPALALEATLTAIKGDGWTDETLVKIITDISNISAGSGATPQQIWEYATRVLTAGTNIDLSALATATGLAAVKSVADDILVDTSTTLDGKLNTVDTNVDSILADTGTDGVVVASGQTVATVTNLTNLPTMPADWVTASGLKADAVTEIQSGLALEATLTAIKGAGWTTETLKVIRDALTAAQADLDNPSQYKADVSGLMTAAAYTAPDNAGIAAIESKTNNLPTSPAPANEYDARMTAIQADLDNPAQYKADVSGLATAAALDAVDNFIDTEITTIDGIVDAIKLKTDLIPATPAQAGEYTAAIAAIPTAPLLAANYTAPDNTSIAAIKEKTDNLPASPAPANEYDTELTAIQTDLDNPDQYKADVSALATTAHVQEVEDKVDIVDGIADSILDDTGTSGVLLSTSALGSIFDDEVIVGTYTFSDLLKIIAAKIAGKATGGGTTTITYRGVDDTSDVIIETVDANGNRSNMTLTV